MKLHLTQADGKNLITASSHRSIQINHQPYLQSLIITPNTIITEPVVSTLEKLSEKDFEKISELRPELVLLGTGENHRFLHPKIYAALTHKGIPLECMATAAACRTYNILMSEGRNVFAMLFLERAP